MATELTLLAGLAPLCVSDIAVGFCTELFATDASFKKGAIISSQQEPKSWRLSGEVVDPLDSSPARA